MGGESGDGRLDRRIVEHVRQRRGQRLFGVLGHTEQLLQRDALGLRPIGVGPVIGHHLGKLGALAEHGIDYFAEIFAVGDGDERG